MLTKISKILLGTIGKMLPLRRYPGGGDWESNKM